jgi:hypothetical protein
MALLDKAKEKATRLAGHAKDKIGEVNERRKAEGLFEELGRILYRQRTQGADPSDEVEIDRLIGQLQSHEADSSGVAPPASAETHASTAPENKFVPEAPPPADV